MPMPQLVKINNFSGQYLQDGCLQKTIYMSLYTCHQIIEMEVQSDSSLTSLVKLCSIVGFIETWREKMTISTCSLGQNIFSANLNCLC